MSNTALRDRAEPGVHAGECRREHCFPEIAFKALYATLFVDAGYDGTPGDRMFPGIGRARNSIGAGFLVPSFILQTYPLTLSASVAKRTDDHRWSWYLSLGPEF